MGWRSIFLSAEHIVYPWQPEISHSCQFYSWLPELFSRDHVVKIVGFSTPDRQFCTSHFTNNKCHTSQRILTINTFLKITLTRLPVRTLFIWSGSYASITQHFLRPVPQVYVHLGYQEWVSWNVAFSRSTVTQFPVFYFLWATENSKNMTMITTMWIITAF